MGAHDLSRFYKAQDGVFERAKAEVADGCKTSHWMWFIFPQLKGLGVSEIADYYGIDDLAEAKRYLNDLVLGKRLREICSALLDQPGRDAERIFGYTDMLKLRSSMTLFDAASPDGENMFKMVLAEFYDGKPDSLTLELLRKEGNDVR